MSNILSIDDINKDTFEEIINLASNRDKIFIKHKNILHNKILGSLFFQASTRTQLSFQSSFLKLGGNFIGFSDINQSRSGESSKEAYEDLGRILGTYCDIAVVRSQKEGVVEKIAKKSSIPIISAGSAQRNHPTQAIIDIFTILTYKKDINKLTILISGYTQYRTINSLLEILTFWSDVNIIILTPKENRLDPRIKDKLLKLRNITFYNSYDEIPKNVLKNIDFLYQEEFHSPYMEEDYVIENYKDFFLTEKILSKFSKDIKILHPLPRTKTIPKRLDEYENSLYFEQATNAIYVRAAIFIYLMKLNNIIS